MLGQRYVASGFSVPSPAKRQAAFIRIARSSPFLGRSRTPFLGQTFDQLLDFSPAMGDVIRLTFHTASAYLGIWVGVKEQGFLKYLGWFLGVGQAVGAVCDAISLAKRATGTHPDEGGPKSVICDYLAPTGLPMAPHIPIPSLPASIPIQNVVQAATA